MIRIILAEMAAACVDLGDSQTSYPKPIELRVGLINSLSGNWAPFGDMTLEGAELAKETIEREGLVRISFEVQDSN